ncbi:ATP-binding protein [Curtobacterium sp. MCBD17_040]|uniref:AAA family ATPase n=1 Tax=Curtobacterium sp. MCBD17_040 TaxID=2175674 RepID=UPI000DA7435C|nr:ATP-binding protein [Curtobacterium sp. MCBD17_040]WIB65352.1 ATP-binding protein [Curtobacterium sp. MCBD17_040]
MASQQVVVALVEAWRIRDDARFEQYAKIMSAEARRKNATSSFSDRIDEIIGRGRVELEAPKDKDSGMLLGRFYDPKLTFDDLALNVEVQQHLDQFLAEVRIWDQLAEHGIRRRNRALFHGPAGCGKTSLASALAVALDRPLLVVETAAITGSLLGQTSKNITNLFDFIEQGKFVVLFDEFDSLGQDRGAQHEHGELRRAANVLLQKIENFEGDSIVIAATNYAGLLDDALWRRFDLVAEMPLPRHDEITRLLAALNLGEEVTTMQAERLVGQSHAAAAFARDSAWRLALVAGWTAPTEEDLVAAVTVTLERPWAGQRSEAAALRA